MLCSPFSPQSESNKGQRDAFLETMQETARRSANDEVGCLRFEVFQDLTDENRFILYEIYSSEDAFRMHLTTAHAKHAMVRSKTWADEGFEVTRAASVYPNDDHYFSKA
jgi:quinol monooxygenase YgiN